VLNSVHDKDWLGNDLGETTIKFYDNTDTEITGGNLNQAYLDANCTRTDIRFTPLVNWGMRGTYCSPLIAPTSDLFVWAFLYDAGTASTVDFGNGGFNLLFIDNKGRVGANEENFVFFDQGSYLHWIFRHAAGQKCRIQCVKEMARRAF
jgi:hypothetical protein